MKTPEFVKLAFSCLLLEIVLVILLPMFGYLALLSLLFMIPMKMSKGLEGSIEWLMERDPDGSRWDALAKSMCGSSLLFLLLCTVHVVWPLPAEGDIWGILTYLFLFLQILRFCGGAVFTVVLSMLTFGISSSRIGKLSSVSALLSSVVGLYFFRELFTQDALVAHLAGVGVQTTGFDFAFLIFFLTLGYLYSLVWGGVVQWGAVKWHEE